ncbi:hypothetical protein IHE45_05G073200 [Dioscorea alata]|uniref:Uncharacterized protein n=1 Tax=Dioscorea alata TaxID=55571 RepID=A0ACB7W2J9_DIOAL|nr:hypothetical protein IHE45_05G073200 [Dioscorea alata]
MTGMLQPHYLSYKSMGFQELVEMIFQSAL